MSTNAEDPTVLLPEIEVSDLVDAIPIDIVGELLTEDDATPSGGGARTTTTTKTKNTPSASTTPTDELNIDHSRPPFKTDSFNRGHQQHQGGGIEGSSGGRSSSKGNSVGGGGSFPSIPPVYSMTSPGRRNSTDQFPSTVGFALKSGSTSSSTDAFAPTPDVETILNGGKPGKPFVPSAGAPMTTGGTTTEATKSTTTTPIVQGPSLSLIHI